MKKRSLAESSELLRIALPLMAKYTIPVTPANYAVWYEYVAGDNTPLKKHVDELIENKHVVNEKITSTLRKNFLDSDEVVEQAEKAQLAMLNISTNVNTKLIEACTEMNTYDDSLEQCQEKITSDIQGDQLAALISELSVSTNNMNRRNKQLLADLQEAQKETETLREELIKTKKEAKTDPLTTLANRAALLECIHEMDKSGDLEKGEHCMILADIDHFKLVNDTYGHIFGDKVLRAVAQIFKANTKGKDLAARFGGEEFIVVLPDTSLKGAQSLAEIIRKTLESARIKRSGSGVVIGKTTISMGVTRMVYGDSFETTVSHADQALYQAKDSGRNKVIVYTPEAFALPKTANQ